jgi:hypothetical protein
MAGNTRKGAMQAAHGYWRPLLSCSSLPTKVRLLMVQTFIYPRSCMARKCGHDEGIKDKMSAVVKKALRSILALHPRDCSSDVLYGTLGYFHPVVLIDAAKLCWQHRCHMEAGRAGLRRCDSHSRVAVVSAGPRWARTGAVMSNPLLSRSSTP